MKSGGGIYWNEITSYDLLGRPLTSKHPFYETDDEGVESNVFAQSSISYSGFTATSTSSNGQQKVDVTNLVGEIVSATNNDSKTATYQYDAYGNMIRMTDPAGNSTRVHYNSLGQKDWMDDPDKGRWEYSYNGVGQLNSQSDSNGFFADQNYDNFGRSVETTTLIPGDVNIPASSHHSKVNFDQYGRVFQSFDAARKGDDFSRGATQNIYDAHGFLWRVVDANRVGGEFATEYYRIESLDVRGRVAHAKMADGVTEAVSAVILQAGEHFRLTRRVVFLSCRISRLLSVVLPDTRWWTRSASST